MAEEQKKAKKKDKSIKFLLTEALEAEMKAYCEEEEISVSELIRRAVKKYLREQGEEHG